MESLRNKQIREVLDIWKNIYSQTFDREKKQVASFQEEVAPRKSRDTDVEVNVEKQIELVTKIIGDKMASLEALIDFFATQKEVGKDAGRRSFISATSVGDFLAGWNQLMRLYKTNGLARTSQELIKVKLQDLTTNLDAMNYGYSKLIDYIFERRTSIEKDIIPILQAWSVFRCAQTQQKTGVYKLIEPIDLDSSFKDILAEQSIERRSFLQSIIRDKGMTITRQVLRQVPMFQGDESKRVKAVEDELGVRLDRRYLNQLPYDQFGEALEKIKNRTRGLKEDLETEKEHSRILEKELTKLRVEDQKNRRKFDSLMGKLQVAQDELAVAEGVEDEKAELDPRRANKAREVLRLMDIEKIKILKRADELSQLMVEKEIDLRESLQRIEESETGVKKALSGAVPDTQSQGFRIGQGRHQRSAYKDSSSDSDSDSDNEYKKQTLKLRLKPLPFDSRRNEMYD